ncbi:Leucine-rich repeat transmembrane protein kinase [Euphorbia peplus]|nr:Leucine-rich repeat transmembrane protein kinase [Euphorbia peplus]
MISCLQHPNLVKLHGFCVEGDQLLVVYEYMYMENNSLARALFDRKKNQLKLDWSARGPEPKISDFGLARLTEEEKSHVSTRVAGTVGYMAPEYALWGHLSDKADVYSFGVVALEIVSGKNNNDFLPSNHCLCLLDWACYLQQTGNFTELVDETLRCKFDAEEAETVVKVALICTSASASVRPTMSEVVNILEGRTPVPDTIPEPSCYAEDMRFKAMRDLRQHTQSTSESQTQNSITVQTFDSCSTLDNEFYEINPKPES